MECNHLYDNVLEYVLLPHYLCSFSIQCLVKDTDNLIQVQGLHYVECLVQNFIDSEQCCSRSINCWQVAYSVLYHNHIIPGLDVKASPTAD